MHPRAGIVAICFALASTCPNVTLAQDTEPSSPEWGSIKSLAINPQNPKILYAGTPAGLFKSTDGAATWQLSNSGLPTPAQSAGPVISLAIDPLTPGTIYAGVRGELHILCLGQCNKTVSGGIFKSTDSGATWSAANVGRESSVRCSRQGLQV
jgi:hypothetical protein